MMMLEVTQRWDCT